MSKETLKQQITVLVNACQNEILLQDVADMLSQNKSVTNEIYYRNRLKESIQQVDAGKVTLATEVLQIARQWIIN